MRLLEIAIQATLTATLTALIVSTIRPAPPVPAAPGETQVIRAAPAGSTGYTILVRDQLGGEHTAGTGPDCALAWVMADLPPDWNAAICVPTAALTAR